MKRKIAVLAFVAVLFACAAAAGAQQITRVAVIDLPKVLAAFSRDAAPLKEFEARKAEVQAEANRRTAEIKGLQARKADADRLSDRELSAQLDSEISRATADLKDFVKVRTAELEAMAKVLGTGSSFLQKLNYQIGQVAEAEGYALVLNLKPEATEANLVLWYGNSVDITDKVIQALSASFK